MKPFRIISFYTKDTPYEQIMKDYLEKSLKKLNLQYTIYSVLPMKSWLENVRYKPSIVKAALEDHPNENIVIIDADATIERYPILFDQIPEEYDLAALTLDWNAWYNRKDKTPHKELLSGTVFFRNNETCMNIVKDWDVHAKMLMTADQRVLEGTLKKMRGSYKLYDLPLEYCYINTLPDGSKPHLKVNNPVIIHYQVSRKLKGLVNR